MGVFDLIKHCLELDDLNFFILSGIWKKSPAIRKAILLRYIHLDPDRDRKSEFGTEEFWNTVERSSQNEEDIEAEEEAWMLRDEYGQAGGQAEVEDHIDPRLEDLYEMNPHHYQHYKRYLSGRVACTVQFKESSKMNDFYSLAEKVWTKIVNTLFSSLEPADKIGVSIHHPCLTDPIHIPLTDRCLLTGEKIAAKIAKVQQSKRDLKYGVEMTATFIYSRAPKGGGFKRDYQGSVKNQKENFSGHGASFITIKNQDNSCCARAIVTAKALADKHPKYNTIRQGDNRRLTIQRKMAEDLMTKAGLKDQKCGFPEIQKMKKVLGPLYQIKVWDRFRELLFQTENSVKVLHLYFDNSHFDVITHIKQFHNVSYFCEPCNKPYKRIEDHVCVNKCPDCHHHFPCQFQQWIFCQECNRNFRSQSCYNNHLKQKSDNNGHDSSICQRIKRCSKWIDGRECGALLKREEIKSHRCGFSKCSVCGEIAKLEEHQCFMQPLKPPSADIEPTFIVFDLETQQTNEYQQTDLGPLYLHEPNLCIAYKFCEECQESVLIDKNYNSCSQCGPNRHTFEGPNTLPGFGKWLYTKNCGSLSKPVVAIAHNARGFDSQFLINYLAERGYRPKIISKGQNIMQMKTANITVKDSLNFLPTSLSALPKTFGFAAKKGYFPHFFNKLENEDYEGPLPDHQLYGTSTMTDSEREKFFDWYEPLKKSGYIFNLKKERWTYCDNDVFICAKAIMEFRDLVLRRTNVDPLLRAMTIASTTSIVYRQNFLPPNTIGLIPPGGYRANKPQSETAFIWLKFISESQNIHIQHARNGGEKLIKIGKRKFHVDGYSEANGQKTIYEFYGCRFHGCPRCFKNRQLKLPHESKTMEERYQNTILRTKTLKKAGYEVIELWGCHLDDLKDRNPELKLFFQRTVIKKPMDPRMAFFGGRTNAVKLLHEFKNGEKGHYVDVCSLYPTTLMYDEFPVGHPRILTENFERITQKNKPYKGIIHCSVVPPRGLLHPVLPYKALGKTMSPLCRTCVENRQQERCSHNCGERELTGAWTHVELYRAVDLGYIVTRIYEVYHYDQWKQFDGKDPKSGLFTEYICVFMKLKQEKSGWPSWVKTDEDIDLYIKNYEERMGIKLDPSQVEKNAGLRAIAKLFLNSFWGKFGQRENLDQKRYVTPKEYFQLFNDPTVKLKWWDMISNGEDDESATMLVTYKMKDGFVKPLTNTNVVLAAYVTAHARLRLYRFLEELQHRVLYFDTDSVFYTSKSGEKNLPIGDYLGDLTDELSEYGEGSYIVEFVSAGPKNYSYKVYSTNDKKIHQVIKVKGHPLDYTAMKHINAKTMKIMVKAFVKSGNKEEVVVVSPRIQRVGHHLLVTRLVRKTYRVVYDKRVVQKDYSTIPYGY